MLCFYKIKGKRGEWDFKEENLKIFTLKINNIKNLFSQKRKIVHLVCLSNHPIFRLNVWTLFWI